MERSLLMDTALDEGVVDREEGGAFLSQVVVVEADPAEGQ